MRRPLSICIFEDTLKRLQCSYEMLPPNYFYEKVKIGAAKYYSTGLLIFLFLFFLSSL